ncbi:MAG: DNA repair protein RecN [Deltaproteobacteria bacterium]|nr:DNA repair protein RecN [Deltaproteobacteria bacterium]
MLRELRIKNFAVIEELSLGLGTGLNVLTGETGAGKTIVLNALGLLSGGRVSADIIRHGEDEASVEALFSPLSAALREKIREGGYDDEEELVVRRIISQTGRNRAYLNGSLCPASLLSEVGAHLIHIYGQHEHHALLKPEAHLSLLDAYGGLGEKVEEMKKRRGALGHAWEWLSEAREKVLRRKQEEELLKAQADEISQANLRSGEEEELRERKNILLHAEKLYRGCKEGEEILYEGDHALAGRLGRYALRLRELANIDGSLSGAVDLLESALAQLEEATSALRHYTSRVQFDPGALEQLEDRLAQLNRLKRKYNASIEEILKLGAQAAEGLESLDRQEEKLPLLEKAFESSRQSAWETAESLSQERKRDAKKFKREMEKELASLGVPRTIFEVRFLEEEGKRDDPPFLVGGKRMTENGIDQIEFYFSPNPGEAVKPLAKIASGGELSRLMLAIKSLVLTQGEIPTLLFDEVDAGIGGAVAEIVGKKLKKVASSQQVICVTHLPQIAALADLHYAVRKEVVKGRTFTEVKKLSEKERVGEIARMLGGVKMTEKTIQHAEEMVKGSGD